MTYSDIERDWIEGVEDERHESHDDAVWRGVLALWEDGPLPGVLPDQQQFDEDWGAYRERCARWLRSRGYDRRVSEDAAREHAQDEAAKKVRGDEA